MGAHFFQDWGDWAHNALLEAAIICLLVRIWHSGLIKLPEEYFDNSTPPDHDQIGNLVKKITIKLASFLSRS
jgi:hypothetical protein